MTRAQIVDAGIAIADAHGLVGLSMRKVAAEVGCEVMSLYNHVVDKDDLLDAMLDRVHERLEVPADGSPWRAGVRAMALDQRALLRRHPWAGELCTARFAGPARRRFFEAMLRLLADAGLGDDLADLAFHAVTVHVLGFTQQEVEFARPAPRRAAHVDTYLADPSSAAESPAFLAHLHFHLERGHRHDDFEFVLDLILDALDARSTPATRRARSAPRNRPATTPTLRSRT